ncbi:VOC family protein [Microvirga arabica]|uniref:VOC family protein n=1 Tax=Microvirga arabica TaxID=1128671 RepID=UPI0024840B79|nr:VOC family protein [Microvirga arabica]
MLVEFTLAGEGYMALNGGPNLQFTPAMSLFVSCNDQAEVDRLWNALLDGGTPVQCGWITDRYGVSWQIVPAALGVMIKDKDAAKVRRHRGDAADDKARCQPSGESLRRDLKALSGERS